jgi:WD40 repeat protein
LTGESNGEVEYRANAVVKVGAPVLGLAAGGSRFLVRTGDELRVYTDDGTLLSTIHAATDHASLSPGGLGLATSKGDVAQIWDPATGKLLHTLSGHAHPITALAYSPSGLELVTASLDHSGIVWSTRSGHLAHRLIGHLFPIYGVGWSKDGHWIVTASQFSAGLWNAVTGQLMFYVGRSTAALTGASFGPTGYTILTGSKDGATRVYDCQVCAPLPRLEQVAAQRLRRLGG